MDFQHTPETLPPVGQVDPAAVAAGYEPHDLKLRGIFTFIGVLAVTLFVVLSVVYGIVMALAAWDRTGDPMASPVALKMPPVYAPLQPSLGFYGDDANNHQALDQDDMLVMRTQTEQLLNAPEGVTAAGRPHMPIELAMEKVLPMLISKGGTPAVNETGQSDGSYEGHFAGHTIPDKKRGIWANDMSNLNNQGN